MSDFTPGTTELPEPNKLVLAYLDGHQEHSGVRWARFGYAFMVHHVEDGGWSRGFMRRACEKLGADHLEVKHWWYLPPVPSED